MSRRFYKCYNPPFAVYKYKLGGYVVRPMDWAMVGERDSKTGELVVGACRNMLHCEEKDEAEMIADVFNRYYDSINKLLQFKKDLKQYENTDKINHTSISTGLVGIRIIALLDKLIGEEDESM